MGCYARRVPEKVAAIQGVDLVIPDVYHPDLPEDICAVPGKRARARIFPYAAESENFFPITQFGTRTRPFVKIQDGCNARCTYCVVRLVRGKSRSVPAGRILDQVRLLSGRGFKEVVLTGINMGLWGNDLSEEGGLLDLLGLLEKQGGVPRIRLSSIEPSDVSRDLIRFMTESPVMVEHFHVPLQSGSEKILKRMNRPYTAAAYRRLMLEIREEMPHAAIGADVITGFPGEDDPDFQETRDFIDRLPLTYLHVFSYSKRPDTEAANFDGEVNGARIRERTRLLRKLSKEKNFAFRHDTLGRDLSCILLHERSREGKSVGLSRNYIRVLVPENSAPANTIARIRIDHVTEEETHGTVLALEG